MRTGGGDPVAEGPRGRPKKKRTFFFIEGKKVKNRNQKRESILRQCGRERRIADRERARADAAGRTGPRMHAPTSWARMSSLAHIFT